MHRCINTFYMWKFTNSRTKMRVGFKCLCAPTRLFTRFVAESPFNSKRKRCKRHARNEQYKNANERRQAERFVLTLRSLLTRRLPRRVSRINSTDRKLILVDNFVYTRQKRMIAFHHKRKFLLLKWTLQFGSALKRSVAFARTHVVCLRTETT